MTHDGIDLVGIVVECAMSWKARATAAPEGIHGDQAVTRRPYREDIPPFPCAAHPAVQEHHRRAGPLFDDLYGAVTWCAQLCRTYSHQIQRYPPNAGAVSSVFDFGVF
jgi:hypothetical protein